MKVSEFLKYHVQVNELYKEAKQVDYYFENMKLRDEMQYLKQENKDLLKRVKDIESSKITPFDINTSFDPKISLYDLERRYILNAVSKHAGNKTEAAQELGITIKTLYNKLHEYGEFK